MSTAFPQEIVDTVIDEVAKLGQATVDASTRSQDLMVCALVSQSFRHRSQHHLFAHAVLSHPVDKPYSGLVSEERTHRLYHILEANPSLRSSIRILDITLAIVIPPPLPAILDFLHGTSCEYRGVHTLKIRITRLTGTVNYHPGYQEFYHALARMLVDCKTSLRALHLKDFADFPINVFLCGHSLTELILDSSHIRTLHVRPEDRLLQSYTDNLDLAPRKIFLQTLWVKKSQFNTQRSLQHPRIAFSALDALSFSLPMNPRGFKAGDLAQLETILQSCRRTLTSLFLGDTVARASIIEFFLPGAIDLSNFPKLKSLRCSFAVISLAKQPLQRLSPALQLFDPPSNGLISLETISISCYFTVGHCSRLKKAFDAVYHGFSKLDSDLTRGRFHKLRAVDLHLISRVNCRYVGCPPEDWEEACLSFLNESFPLLRSSPSIKFTIDHRSMQLGEAIDNGFEWKTS